MYSGFLPNLGLYVTIFIIVHDLCICNCLYSKCHEHFFGLVCFIKFSIFLLSLLLLQEPAEPVAPVKDPLYIKYPGEDFCKKFKPNKKSWPVPSPSDCIVEMVNTLLNVSILFFSLMVYSLRLNFPWCPRVKL